MLDNWVAETAGLNIPINREELEAWQLRQLNRVLKRAADNSPFYRKRFLGVQVSSLDEYGTLPFTFPEDVRREGGRMLVASPNEIRRIASLPTSGSEGEPKRIYFSEDDLASTEEFFAHGLNEFVTQGDRALLLFPGNNPDGLNDLIMRALKRLDCQGFYFGYPDESRVKELLNRLIKDKITYLIGTARTLAASALYSEQCGMAESIAAQVHGVLAAAAFVPERDRQEVIRIWNCDYNEYYGMTETGFACAVGCPAPGGYHVWESGLYIEIIDPCTGRLVPDGEEGEIVVTTLTQRAMPFIRYRTGDISRFIPGKCYCGSGLKRLERVHDRPSGKKYERMIEFNA